MKGKTGGTTPVEAAYIHIPFCKSKCFYCDFNSFSGCESYIKPYFDALKKEITMVYTYYQNKPGFTGHPLKTVFIGGGTPSYVPAGYIAETLTLLRSLFGFTENAEISMECNPGTITAESIDIYKKAGINRISIGLQSASDRLLRNIGRIHTRQEFEFCVDELDRVGIVNRNVDLMFGLPGQTMEDVDSSIDLLLSRCIPHISFYSLILEEGTPFYEKFKDHPEFLPSEELEREMYHYGIKKLEKFGYMQYEISNLAKPGYECLHNINYWKCGDYFGFGAGAHSFQQNTRYGNEPDIRQYIDRVGSCDRASAAPAFVEEVNLNTEDREQEYFMLGFRMMRGVSEEEFTRLFHRPFLPYVPRLEKLVAKEFLECDRGFYRLTKTGIDFANQVFMEFV